MAKKGLHVALALVACLTWAVPPAGGADKPVEGDKLLLRDPVNPATARLVFLSVDPNITFGSNGDSDNPAANGASLLYFNPLTGEYQCLLMPASNWKIGATGKSFTYRDTSFALGPVKVALVRAGKVKVIAKGAGLTFSLDETTQGEMAAHFTSGTGNKLCTHVPVPRVDQVGVFLGVGAAPPVACQTEPAPCVPPGM